MERNDGESLTIAELAERADTSVRTVRYYITQRLLPPAIGRGVRAHYTTEHLDRLRLVRRLSAAHVPLPEQREYVARLSGDAVRSALARTTATTDDDLTQSGVVHSVRDDGWQHMWATAPHVLQSESPTRPSSIMGRVEIRDVSSNEPPAAPAAWRRWELASGVELHVRADAELALDGFIGRLLRTAGIRVPPKA